MRFISHAEVAEAATYQVEFNPACFVLLDIERDEYECPHAEVGDEHDHITWRVTIGEQSERQIDISQVVPTLLPEKLAEMGLDTSEAAAMFLERSTPEFVLSGTLEQIAVIAASLTRAVTHFDAEVYANAMDWVIENEEQFDGDGSD